MTRFLYRVSAIAALAALTACSEGEKKEHEAGEAERKPAAPTAAEPQVTPTGRTVVVEMHTDEKGNYFKPNRFEVHRGDKIVFTLVSGVHNVHFLPDSNPGKAGLPSASEMLQLPGQTFEVLVSFAPGKYYFQCDPHALLGMTGRIEVEDEE